MWHNGVHQHAELHKVPVLRTLYGGRHDQMEIRPFSFSAIGTKLRPKSHHRPPNTADTAPNTADIAPNTADTDPITAALIVGLIAQPYAKQQKQRKATIYGRKTSKTHLFRLLNKRKHR